LFIFINNFKFKSSIEQVSITNKQAKLGIFDH